MRNILFLLVDCLRADAVRGDERKTVTPTVDRLMTSGTCFEQAIAVASTTSTCVASLLTGKYPFSHGVRTLYGHKLNGDCVTLPQFLQHRGYHTYGLATGPLSPLTGLDRGFGEYECRSKDAYLSEPWGEDLRHRLRHRAFQEPWFIFLHLWEIHKPRKILDGFNSKHFGADPYERAVSSLDAELTRLIASVGEDTVVILHGDHGENREAVRQTLRYRFYHRLKRRMAYPVDPRFYKIGHNFHVYDFLVRVPLLFYGSGLFPAGKVIHDQVRQIDVFPTLIEALGFDSTPPMDGRSLVPLMEGASLPGLPAHVAAVGESLKDSKDWRVGIRTGEWKYAFAPRNPAIPEELYHLSEDPDEWRNLVKKKREVAEEMRRQLLEIISGTYYVGENSEGEEMSDQEKRMMEERLKQLGYL